LTLVTELSPVIGYDKASAIAHKANDEDMTLKEAALQSGDIDEKRFDEIVDPKRMVGYGLAAADLHVLQTLLFLMIRLLQYSSTKTDLFTDIYRA
jgi:hypothetical protein